jgi:hypothetical protein
MFRVNPGNLYDRRQAMTEFLGARYRVFSREAQPRPKGASLADEQLQPGTLDNYLRVPASLTASGCGAGQAKSWPASARPRPRCRP